MITSWNKYVRSDLHISKIRNSMCDRSGGENFGQTKDFSTVRTDQMNWLLQTSAATSANGISESQTNKNSASKVCNEAEPGENVQPFLRLWPFVVVKNKS